MKKSEKRSILPDSAKHGSEEMSFQLAISPTWSLIQDIREKTKSFMKDKGRGKDLTEATIMCATELIENAIKYGSGNPDNNNITFNLSADNSTVSIRISNYFNSRKDIKVLIEHIEKIRKSEDAGTLYTHRLKELMSNPKPGVSQLGLFRIAFEGKFRLDYECADKVLTITASRTL